MHFLCNRATAVNVIKWGKGTGPNHNGLKAEKVKDDFPIAWRQPLEKQEVKNQPNHRENVFKEAACRDV